MANVLIIDDDKAMAQMLAKMILKIHHRAEFELTLGGGMQKALGGRFDVIFLDVHMPDGNGLDALKQLRRLPDPPEVIIITGLGRPAGAEMAIRNGAWDYIQKPLSPKKVILPIKRVLQYRDNLKAIGQMPVVLNREGIVGKGAKIEACLKKLARAAFSEASVLITGETGTGKELFAKTLHVNGNRKANELVVVDCGALPETLAESALFGHLKGAFTGADQSKTGLIKMADQGILFLDEVCELSLALQKALLRVLQEKKFRPVGGRKEVGSNFRLVAATNRDPDEMVRQGLFRKDLLYRLRAIEIHLPPLRERIEDMAELVLYYTELIARRYGYPQKGFSPEFIKVLCRYDWPGNIRELLNVMENAISTAKDEPILFPIHLPEQIRVSIARASLTGELKNGGHASVSKYMQTAPIFNSANDLPTFRAYREDLLSRAEKEYFKQLIVQTKGNIKDACKMADLGRTRLYTLLKKHGLKRKR